jgi:hypothetical protein
MILGLGFFLSEKPYFRADVAFLLFVQYNLDYVEHLNI